jgi:hypothetical protein
MHISLFRLVNLFNRVLQRVGPARLSAQATLHWQTQTYDWPRPGGATVTVYCDTGQGTEVTELVHLALALYYSG